MDGIALNFVSEISDARIRRTFGPEKYRRLVALKDTYDPDNLFRLNQNVPPSTLVRTGSDQPSAPVVAAVSRPDSVGETHVAADRGKPGKLPVTPEGGPGTAQLERETRLDHGLGDRPQGAQVGEGEP